MPELLGDFFSESDLPSKASAVVVRQPHDGVSIAELRGSVTLEWYEAIAISQALCDTLSRSQDRVRPALVSADSVLIAETGEVSVAATTVHSSGPTALQQVADLLRAMMPERGVPTPLRLAVLQSSSAGSLADWSNTIEYYERPNRKAIIQAVYRRALHAPDRPPVHPASVPRQSEIRHEAPPSSQSQLFQPQSFEPLPPQPLPPRPALPLAVVRYARDWRLPRPTAKHVLVAGGALACVVLVWVGAWLMQRPPGRAAEAVANITDSTVSAVREVVSQPEVAGHVSSVSPAPGPPTSAPGRQWIRLEPLKLPPQPRAGDNAKATRQLPTVDPAARAMPSSTEEPVIVLPVPRVEPAGRAMPSSTGEPATASPATIARVLPVSSIIYSKADRDVVPPTAIYPRFPSALPAGISPNEVAEFDVIVTETGSVESVRALRVPVTMAEAMRVTMSLSAAKSWRFAPGMKDGQPVRYRQVLWVLKN